MYKKKSEKLGSTEIWTRIAGFRVLSANHYTIEPPDSQLTNFTPLETIHLVLDLGLIHSFIHLYLFEISISWWLQFIDPNRSFIVEELRLGNKESIWDQYFDHIKQSTSYSSLFCNLYSKVTNCNTMVTIIPPPLATAISSLPSSNSTLHVLLIFINILILYNQSMTRFSIIPSLSSLSLPKTSICITTHSQIAFLSSHTQSPSPQLLLEKTETLSF